MGVTNFSVEKAKLVIKEMALAPLPRSALIEQYMAEATFYNVLKAHPHMAADMAKANAAAAIVGGKLVMENVKDTKAILMMMSRTLPRNYGKNREDQIRLNLPAHLRLSMRDKDASGRDKLDAVFNALAGDEITEWQFRVCAAAIKSAHPEYADEVNRVFSMVELPSNGRLRKQTEQKIKKAGKALEAIAEAQIIEDVKVDKD